MPATADVKVPWQISAQNRLQSVKPGDASITAQVLQRPPMHLQDLPSTDLVLLLPELQHEPMWKHEPTPVAPDVCPWDSWIEEIELEKEQQLRDLKLGGKDGKRGNAGKRSLQVQSGQGSQGGKGGNASSIGARERRPLANATASALSSACCPTVVPPPPPLAMTSACLPKVVPPPLPPPESVPPLSDSRPFESIPAQSILQVGASGTFPEMPHFYQCAPVMIPDGFEGSDVGSDTSNPWADLESTAFDSAPS